MANRFFTSLVTARPLELGGRSFVFEPVSPLGGGWLGVLVEADEASASILAAATDVVSEITEAEYDRLKKKLKGQATSPVSGQLPTPRPELQRLAPGVARAAPPTSTGSEAPAASPVVAAKEEAAGPSVELQMTDKEPPPEPLLDIAPKKRPRGKKGGP